MKCQWIRHLPSVDDVSDRCCRSGRGINMKGAQGVRSHVASSSVRLAMIFIFANKTTGDIVITKLYSTEKSRLSI